MRKILLQKRILIIISLTFLSIGITLVLLSIFHKFNAEEEIYKNICSISGQLIIGIATAILIASSFDANKQYQIILEHLKDILYNKKNLTKEINSRYTNKEKIDFLVDSYGLQNNEKIADTINLILNKYSNEPIIITDYTNTDLIISYENKTIFKKMHKKITVIAPKLTNYEIFFENNIDNFLFLIDGKKINLEPKYLNINEYYQTTKFILPIKKNKKTTIEIIVEYKMEFINNLVTYMNKYFCEKFVHKVRILSDKHIECNIIASFLSNNFTVENFYNPSNKPVEIAISSDQISFPQDSYNLTWHHK